MGKQCQVCHDSAKGIHFGVFVCAACSAFFRRSVVKENVYKCAKQNACEVLSTIRSMCRSCRFAKCLAVGMRKDGVQRHRDLYGKREKSEDVPSTSSESSFKRFSLLDEVVRNYLQLEKIRQVIHKDEEDSVFSRREPRRLNYKETIKVFLKEYHLLQDWINNSFKEFSDLPENQKTLLLRNFYISFVILEGGFFACRNGRSDITFLPSGDFIDCVNPETYYCDPDGKQPISADEAAKLFASSFGNYRRNVYNPMIRDCVDCPEFLSLAALTLFDTGLEGQSDDCIDMCRNVREKLQRELMQYCRRKCKEDEDPTIRLGNILSILPNLQRAARRLQEDMTLSNVINAYMVDQTFYNLGEF